MRQAPSSSRLLEVELPLAVRTYDIDFAGHVSNIVYIRWLEDLRLEFLNEYLPLQEQWANGVIPVLASTHIQYRRPIFLFDQPVGRLWMSRAERVRWTLESEIVVAGRPAATAVQTGAFVSRETQRPVALPEALRAKFAERAGTNG
jgi:acyl-CoA thioester hydrolase